MAVWSVLPASVMPRCLARVWSSAVSGVAASTEAPTIGATCSRVFDRVAAVWADVAGIGAAGAGDDGVGAAAVVAAALPGLAAGDWAGNACVDVDGGVIAEGSRTSFAFVQAASTSAASNDTVVTCDRLICLITPWR
ncbi:hypothetical protein MESS4_830054 [Mesorhizobium sp. STM 4661]|nr:hypothetical protein MESS4_830054 [Mesorhizobium sp. STM 4661]